jgi:hypothetical protein
MLDIPHTLYLKMAAKKPNQRGVKDEWYFDYAYFFAFNFSVFIIVLVFSISAPLLSMFGLIYFAIRYLVDKYNFLYRYPKEFDSNGDLSRALPSYLTFSLFFF